MSKPKERKAATTSVIIAGKKVKVATEKEVKAVTNKIKKQYAQALENLKNR